MRQGRFIEDQIIGVLGEHEAGAYRRAVPEAQYERCNVLQLEVETGRTTVSEAARLQTLKHQNRRLKKLLAESVLDVSALKDLLRKTDPACGSLRCGREADDRPRLL